MTLICQTSELWSDPRLVYAVAVAAVVLLAVTIWLFRRTKRDGRAAGTICLLISAGLHGALIWLVPYQAEENGGSATVQEDPESHGVDVMAFSTFDPLLEVEDASGESDQQPIAPLPVADLNEILEAPAPTPDPVEQDTETPASETVDQPPPEPMPPELMPAPQSLTSPDETPTESDQADLSQDLDASLEELLLSQLELEQDNDAQAEPTDQPTENLADNNTGEPIPPAPSPPPQTTAQMVAANPQAARTQAASTTIPADERSDFANRIGAAKQKALNETGGDARTEAAVQAALRFLASAQRRDGAWDPRSSGAGLERRPLGESRPGAGTKSTTGLTGLSLLAMMGSGHTHLSGDYADNVFRGLAYQIKNQNPNGSLSGNATVYAASYCHSMAALALCEAAVMTQDPSAIEASRRAIAHTTRMQHPVTGGWRYTRGDPGDLSQLGWQAMVLDGGKRAGINVRRENIDGVARFLRSVRAGQGGLACYRPNEATSRTMTAEALATRLLIGEDVPQREIDEAERFLLESLPGTRQDNYYYWYYATLALHQQQDAAWNRWNTALKNRLLATQRADGSWPSNTLWGGYGGTVYTTAMATLCLETYYRHAIRDSNARVATRPQQSIR